MEVLEYPHTVSIPTILLEDDGKKTREYSLERVPVLPSQQVKLG